MWSILIALLTLAAASQPQAPVSEALRARVEFLHEQQAARVGGVRLAHPDAVSHFFQARNFAPAWTNAAVAEIVQAIHDIEQDGLRPSDCHLAAIDALRARRDQSSAPPEDLQIVLTDALATLVDHVRFGKVRPSDLDRRWNVNPREGSPPLETILAEIAAAGSVRAAVEAQKPAHFIYRGLKQALAEKRAAAAAGGWPAVPAGPTLKPGASDSRIVGVRARLPAIGEFAGTPDSPDYDDLLADAVKVFQDRHRLTPDAAIGRATLAPMRQGQTPVARKGLTILDRQGRAVPPDSIDWSAATPGNFPFTLRQPPGPDNALGRVKFIFPNEHAIFLHDTPSRELFAAEARTFSSGCIRVERPLELVEVLLGSQGWDAGRIQDTVRGGKTETVYLDRPLPVLIVYWTVSVRASGTLRYASDIYHLDAAVQRALDAPAPCPQGRAGSGR